MYWDCLSEIALLSRRVVLAGVAPDTRMSELRNVWGDTVCRVSPKVFGIIRDGNQCQPRPAYVLHRLRSGGPSDAYVFRWTLLGMEAIRHDELLRLAWDVAGQRGLGRGRVPFQVLHEDMAALGPDGRALPPGSLGSWRANEALWPGTEPAADQPCRLVFYDGISVISKSAGSKEGPAQGGVGETKIKAVTVAAPDWERLVRSAWNRVNPWLSPASRHSGNALLPAWLEEAARRPTRACWRLNRAVRWSFSREKGKWVEKEYYVSEGHMDLPAGPGSVWPLISAVYWLGLGRHTTEGFGVFDILPLPPS